MYLWGFCVTSMVLFALVVIQTGLTYPNYFSALVGLTDSSLKSHIVICFAFSMAILWTKFVIFLFMGGIRPQEIQAIYQRGWVYVCSTVLYWGISSRKTYDNPYNVAVCVLSLFILLILHWVSMARVRSFSGRALDLAPKMIFEQVRLGVLCVSLLVIDIGLIATAIQRYREHDFTLYMFSYTLIELARMSCVTNLLFPLNLYAGWYLLKNEDEDDWEHLTLLTAGINFFCGLLSSLAHLKIGIISGSSINNYMSIITSFFNVFQYGSALVKAIKAKREIDVFTEPALDADLQRDNTCVICRDTMSISEPGGSRIAPKKLRCGHVMHSKCLVSWLAQSLSCPTCRQPVKSAVSSFKPGEVVTAQSTEVVGENIMVGDVRESGTAGTDAHVTTQETQANAYATTSTENPTLQNPLASDDANNVPAHATYVDLPMTTMAITNDAVTVRKRLVFGKYDILFE